MWRMGTGLQACSRLVRATLRSRWAAAGLAVVAGLVVGAVLRSPAILTSHFRNDQLSHSAGLVLRSWSAAFVTPWFWAFLIAIAVLERLFPARRGDGMFTVGAAQDLVWFVCFAGFQMTVVRCYYALLAGADQSFLRGIALRPALYIGAAGTAVFVFVLSDFLSWVSHYVRHFVPAFWHFHEIHHSQQSMNVFTDSRVHFVEPIIAGTITFVPSALLGLGPKQAVALTTVSLFYERFFHSNIRTNLGPLRYILVTPQSHRLHHSSRPEDYDSNFATIFSVWDRIFRTQNRAAHVYPPTGLTGSAVPMETSSRPGALLTTYVRQLAYPFRAVRETSRVNPMHPSNGRVRQAPGARAA